MGKTQESRWQTAAALAAIALIASGIVYIVLLHVFEPRLDPVTTPISDYDETPHRGLLLSSYVVFGAGGSLVGAALWPRARTTSAGRWGALSLVAAGVFIAALAAWPEPPLHVPLLVVGQGLLLAAVLLLGARLAEKPLRTFSWGIVGLTVASLARAQAILPWPGAVQRAYFVAITSWVVAAGVAAFARGVTTRAPRARTSS